MDGQPSILKRAGPLMIARFAIALVTFGTPLILARVLIRDDYGTFKLSWLWCTTLGTILPMGLTPSLIYFVPREPERRRFFISHALLLTTGLGACVGTLLYLYGPAIARAMHQPDLAAHRVEVLVVVARLRAFLRFCFEQEAVPERLDIIDAPRVYRGELPPRAPAWPLVQRLLRSVDRGEVS